MGKGAVKRWPYVHRRHDSPCLCVGEMRCLAAGMDTYISKPIDMKQFIELIEDLIGKRDLDA